MDIQERIRKTKFWKDNPQNRLIPQKVDSYGLPLTKPVLHRYAYMYIHVWSVLLSMVNSLLETAGFLLRIESVKSKKKIAKGELLTFKLTPPISHLLYYLFVLNFS